MITGSLRNKVDKLWLEFWQGGIANPLTVIEQITFLMFARLLDINETRDEKREGRTGKSFTPRFAKDQQHLRWSQFVHEGDPDRLLEIVRDEVFKHFREHNSDIHFGDYMKDARLVIEKPAPVTEVPTPAEQVAAITDEVSAVAPEAVSTTVEGTPDRGESTAGGDLDGYTILVTDDEPDFVTFASAILEDNGAKVLQAYNGEEAMDIARREKPDLMTLDLSMPGTSGSDVFEKMRQDPELTSQQIFIITGQPELRRLIYAKDFRSPEGYLDKPITEESLLFNVRKVLNVQH